MIVTLAGDNDFGLQQELAERQAAFVSEQGDLALERIDAEEAELENIQEALTSLPFLASKKMVVLHRPSTNKQFVERAEQIFEQVPDTTEVILVEPRLDKRLGYYKYLQRHTDFKDFSALDAVGLSQWLVQQAKARGGTLNPADARYLVDRVGANQQLLAGELEKLVLYDPHITRQTIDRLTDPTPQSSIFELLEAAFAGNAPKTMKLYAEQRALKVEPAQIIAMLAWQLHVLASIKAAGDQNPETIAKASGLNPYVVKKSQATARKLSSSELKQLIADLLNIDLRSKTTAIDADEALQQYLFRLATS